MKAKTGLVLSLACFLVSATVAANAGTVAVNASSYVVTLEEIGPNVVATGSGQIGLSGLSKGSGPGSAVAFVEPYLGLILTGATRDAAIETYSLPSLTARMAFGNGGGAIASSGSGDDVGLCGGFCGSIAFQTVPLLLYVPAGYVSETPLSDSAIYDNTSLTGLGATRGTYVWKWGTGTDQSFTLNVSAVSATPLPDPLPLFATALGGLGLLGWRRKRKAAFAVA